MEPRRVTTHEELVAALRTLLHLTELSYSQLEMASGGKLHRSTVSDMLTGRSLPSWETISTFLAICGDRDAPRDEWRSAWQRVRGDRGRARQVPSPRRTTVVNCDPHELGVHRALTSPTDPTMPDYVSRDVDQTLELAITSARDSGGLLLVVGPTGAGKTRAVYEALRHVVPHFAVLRPTRRADLETTISPHTVVWLDDLAQLLEDKHSARGLMTTHRRSGLRRSGSAILVGTLWPSQYQRYVALPELDATDPYAMQRHLLTHANVIDMHRELSMAERARVIAAAKRDNVIAAALTATDFQPFQVIAGARHLVRRWRNAADPYGRALISAAVDARRSGVTTALTAERLRASAQAYLTPVQRGEAPVGWFERGLAYATAKLPGGVAALVPVHVRRETGQPYGYLAAEFLVLHGGELPVHDLVTAAQC